MLTVSIARLMSFKRNMIFFLTYTEESKTQISLPLLFNGLELHEVILNRRKIEIIVHGMSMHRPRYNITKLVFLIDFLVAMSLCGCNKAKM